MGFLYSWGNIKRVLAKLLAYMYTYNKLNWVVSMTSVHLGDVAERCCGPFHTTQYIPVFAWDFYSTTRNPDTFRSRSWNTINSSTRALSHRYPAWEPKYPQAGLEHSQQCCHHFAQTSSIHGSLYLWGRSVQEMGGNVVTGRSIYGVVVIDGSLYSQIYGMVILVQSQYILHIHCICNGVVPVDSFTIYITLTSHSDQELPCLHDVMYSMYAYIYVLSICS